jgi:hypothetical protein
VCLVVGISLPTHGKSDGIESGVLDYLEIPVVNCVSPAIVVLAVLAVGIPGVSEVDSLAEPLVHGATFGIVYGNDFPSLIGGPFLA